MLFLLLYFLVLCSNFCVSLLLFCSFSPIIPNVRVYGARVCTRLHAFMCVLKYCKKKVCSDAWS